MHPPALRLAGSLATPWLFHPSDAWSHAERAVVIALSRPEPFVWFSTPAGQTLLPLPDSCYLSSAGEDLISPQHILNCIYDPALLPLQQPNRDPVVLRAVCAFANSLYNPAATSRGQWHPTVEPFTLALPTIETLIAHPFWQQVEGLATALPLRHRRLPIATTADLLVRFRNGDDIGIGMVQTCTPDQINPARVAAEVGAALALLGDTNGWWPRRAFVVFCSPGKTSVELVDVDAAVSRWVDAIDLYRFMSRRLKWSKPL